MIDYDLLAVRFAKVNRVLLAVSTSRADYVNLRLTASQDVWQQRSQQLGGEDKETLATPHSWAFWDKRVRKSSDPVVSLGYQVTLTPVSSEAAASAH